MPKRKSPLETLSSPRVPPERIALTQHTQDGTGARKIISLHKTDAVAEEAKFRAIVRHVNKYGYDVPHGFDLELVQGVKVGDIMFDRPYLTPHSF